MTWSTARCSLPAQPHLREYGPKQVSESSGRPHSPAYLPNTADSEVLSEVCLTPPLASVPTTFRGPRLGLARACRECVAGAQGPRRATRSARRLVRCTNGWRIAYTTIPSLLAIRSARRLVRLVRRQSLRAPTRALFAQHADSFVNRVCEPSLRIYAVCAVTHDRVARSLRALTPLRQTPAIGWPKASDVHYSLINLIHSSTAFVDRGDRAA
jgi:hypothetical protein